MTRNPALDALLDERFGRPVQSPPPPIRHTPPVAEVRNADVIDLGAAIKRLRAERPISPARKRATG